MVANFARGGAAINVLARQAGAELEIVDVGVKGDTAGRALNRKATPGASNVARGDAMTDVSLNHARNGGRLPCVCPLSLTGLSAQSRPSPPRELHLPVGTT